MSTTSTATTTSSPPKKIIITGANSGIGLTATIDLAKLGHEVVMGCRDAKRAESALATVRQQVPDARVSVMPLDLADLKSVRAFAQEYQKRHSHVDVLINNAGVMAMPKRQLTKDGLEMQMGTNHFGHFALTGLLMPALEKSKAPRVVNISSIAARRGVMVFDDLQSEREYTPWTVYQQTKLANLLFTQELQRRFGKSKDGKDRVFAVAAHPGIAATNLAIGAGAPEWVLSSLQWLWAQPAERGSLPTVHAATSSAVKPAGFYGPNGLSEFWGRGVAEAWQQPAALDADQARKLWDASVKVTGVKY